MGDFELHTPTSPGTRLPFHLPAAGRLLPSLMAWLQHRSLLPPAPPYLHRTSCASRTASSAFNLPHCLLLPFCLGCPLIAHCRLTVGRRRRKPLGGRRGGEKKEGIPPFCFTVLSLLPLTLKPPHRRREGGQGHSSRAPGRDEGGGRAGEETAFSTPHHARSARRRRFLALAPIATTRHAAR